MTRIALTTLITLASACALPEGFEIRPFAAPFDADYPAAITVAPNGDVYVSSDQNGSLGHAPDMGRIIRCRDTDGDGRADEFIHFVPKVNSPRGGHIVGDTLYLIHPPYLSSFRDTNGDGVADEHKVLVSGLGGGIEHPRGADHTTNGVRMGIDGWLYISVGDFGTTPAQGSDGKTYLLHGGGVLRVRPDGSEIEPYALMVRNICDTAISPTLDLFSRDNTNDGKGWNVRFHHYTALGDHGYPRLYQHFADEAVAPLADYGGGSGTGMLWLDEPGFPGDFGKRLYSCDWTTGKIYSHPLRTAGASFEITQEVFLEVPRAIDIDVDGFSRLYIADWRNGAYNYAGPGKKVGMIQQLVPKQGTAARYQDVSRSTEAGLVELLASNSQVQRFAAQRELISHPAATSQTKAIHAIASDRKQPLETRVAAIFACKQIAGKASTPLLIPLLKDDAVREFALRAMTDRLGELEGVPVDAYVAALKDPNHRVVLQALIGLQRLQAKSAAAAVIAAAPGWNEPGTSPRLQLTAATVLRDLAQLPALLDGAQNPSTRTLCLRALGQWHQPEVIDALIRIAKETRDADLQLASLLTLARLHFKEAPWDGKAWWGTRPDDRGPYYAPVEWEESAKIRAALEHGFTAISKDRHRDYLAGLAANRIAVTSLQLPGLDPVMAALGNKNPSAEEINILTDAARDPKQAFARRLECYQAISRHNPRKNSPQRIEILAVWSQESGLPAEVAQHIDDFVNDSARAEELKTLRQLAAQGSDAVSTLAWKAILTVTISPLAKEPRKQEARKLALDHPREVGFFNALAALKLPGYEAQIESGLTWDNAELIAAAKRAKEATGSQNHSGKKVAELSAQEVTQALMQSAGQGDLAEGKRLFTTQGCIACHAVDPAAAQKGPDLGSAGSKFTRDYLIESILDPNAIVAQGFQSTLLTTKGGQTHMGFIVSESDGTIELRNIAGQASQIKRAEVASEQTLPQSMMPAGLAAGLTVGQLNALIDYLVSMKSAK